MDTVNRKSVLPRLILGLQSNPYLMASLVAVIMGASTVLSGYISKNIIAASEPEGITKVMAATAFLLIGAWTGVVVFIIMSWLFPKTIDGNSQGIRMGDSTIHSAAIKNGLAAAVTTGLMLFAQQTYDPSFVQLLIVLVLPYNVMFDALWRRNIKLRKVLIPVFLCMVGAAVSSYSVGAKFAATAIAVMLIGHNTVSMIGSQLEQDGSRTTDATLFSFWRFVYLALAAVPIVLAVNLLNGVLRDYLHFVVSIAPRAIPWVVPIMIGNYYVNGWRAKAKQDKQTSVSEVEIIVNLQLLIVFLISLALNVFAPELLIKFDPSLGNVTQRGIGVIFVLVGVAWLILTRHKKH